MMDSSIRPRASALAALALAAVTIASAVGCLRQTGAVVSEPNKKAAALKDQDERPIVEDNRPSASFILNGEPFCFAGTNNYYVTFQSQKMVDDVLERAKALGLKVIRIWGMIDRGSLDGAVRNIDGKGEKNGVYFQYWDTEKKRPAYNDGKTGLEHLDYVLDKARKLDLKIMPVMVNNWKHFGGMDQYVVWFGLKYHHQFYTDPQAVGAYKEWLRHVIERKNTVNGVAYKDDPTLFAWQLANEPRCGNAGEFEGPGCTVKTLVKWADDMSTYVKSLDSNHMVSVGDEGFYANGGSEAQYDGSDGVDHDALIALKNIDFGTFHLYPDTWGRRLSWATKWIQDHIDSARKAGKPTLLEEYGVVVTRNDEGKVVDATKRFKAYPRWHDILQKRGGNGGLNWMLAGVSDGEADARGRYKDFDRFTVYTDEPTGDLIKQFASRMSTDAQSCRLFKQYGGSGATLKSPFVTTARPPSSRPQALNASSSLPPT